MNDDDEWIASFWLTEDSPSPAWVEAVGGSRRVAARPDLPPPVRAVDLRQPGPVIPRHGALGRALDREKYR